MSPESGAAGGDAEIQTLCKEEGLFIRGAMFDASGRKKRACLHGLAGGLFFCLALLLDILVLKIPFFSASSPHLFDLYLVRLLLIFLCSFHVIQAVKLASLPRTSVWADPYTSSAERLKSSVCSKFSEVRTSFPCSFFISSLILLLGVFFVALFLIYPRFFSIIAREHLLIETFSAYFCFFAGIVLLYCAFLSKRWPKGRKALLLFIIPLVGLLFLMGMEEQSWFQFMLEIDLPEYFSSNAQNDMNLHNFATEYFENIYYFGGFLFLVLIPFLFKKNIFRKSDLLDLLVPGDFAVAAGALAVAYNYDDWNVLIVQLSFFLTFFILIDYTWAGLRDRRVFWVTLLLVFVVSQAAWLIFGYNFVRLWDVSEYKEFFIPLGLAIYSLEVLFRLRRLERTVSASI
jgi:hypothetical protein